MNCRASISNFLQGFFVIRLQAAEAVKNLGPIVDPDVPMSCDLMDGRDSFLTLAREKHYEFSSLRRVKVIIEMIFFAF